MQLQIESTDLITSMDGVPVRLRKGRTADGMPCKVFVHRVFVLSHNDYDCEAFERDLQEQLPPGRTVPLAHVL